MKRYKKIILPVLILFLVLIGLAAWANSVVKNSSEPFLTDNIDEVSDFEVGLLLGTSKYVTSGRPNEYFLNRIQAAIELYREGKIKYILISGDNSTVNYNEPQDMKTELVKQGVPDNVIYLDYAGFRTFDSVVRSKEIFGQNRIIIISQKFHNERAVYIARELGIDAYGYNAKDVTAYGGFKTKVREFLAKANVYVDLAFGVRPRFLGEKIKIG